MSTLARLLEPRLPQGMSIPEELDRAWSWLEDQGWGVQDERGYRLAAVPPKKPYGVVFGDHGSLTGWFEPGAEGAGQVWPIAQIGADGSMAVLWNDGGTIRVGALGSDGEIFLLAETGLDFVRLVSIGYDEIPYPGMLAERPQDSAVAAAHKAFRQWVTAEFATKVPRTWTTADPDPFRAWVQKVKGIEPEPVRVFRGDEPVDVDAQTILDLAEQLNTEPVFDLLAGRTIGGTTINDIKVELITYAQIIQLLDAESEFPEDSYNKPPPRVAGLRAAAIARWGEPLIHQRDHELKSWLDGRLREHDRESAEYWDLGDHLVALLYGYPESDEMRLEVMPHTSRTTTMI